MFKIDSQNACKTSIHTLPGLKRFVAVFAVLAFCLPSLVNGEDPSKEDNAATFYLKVFEQIQYPDSDAEKEAIQTIIEEGWNDDYPALEKLLEGNRSWRKDFTEALSIQKCDFQFGKKPEYIIKRKTPPIPPFIQLKYILILKIRHKEKMGKGDEALKSCLNLLKVAQHLAQDGSLIALSMVFIIEEQCWLSMESLLKTGGVSQEGRDKARAFLEDYKAGRFPARLIIDTEKAFYLSTIQMLVDQISADDPVLKNKQGVAKFKRMMGAESQRLADYYYGMLAKAAESNDEQDWKAVSEAYQKLNERFAEPHSKYVEDPMQVIRHYEGDLDELLVSKLLECTLLLSWVDFDRPVNNYYASGKKLEAWLTGLKGEGKSE